MTDLFPTVLAQQRGGFLVADAVGQRVVEVLTAVLQPEHQLHRRDVHLLRLGDRGRRGEEVHGLAHDTTVRLGLSEIRGCAPVLVV